MVHKLVNAFRAKRKLGFIDGSITKPSIDDPQFELWSSVNSMIVGWIRSSIEARVRSTVTFISDSHKLWENLKKRFSVGNKVRIHHLKEQLASCKQDRQIVMGYFGRLAKMWEELDTTNLFHLAVAVLLRFMRKREKKQRCISSSWA